MISVEKAIARVNRDLALAWGIHVALGVAMLVALVAGTATGIHPMLLVSVPCALWIVLAINGVRETKAAMEWQGLIASGQLDEAEKQIERRINGFGVLRSVKLMSLHQLAVVKLGQKQWGDALKLSRALTSYRAGKQQSLHRAGLLVMAGAAVNEGAYPDAYVAMSELRRMPLTLDEQLSLLPAEVMYCARLGEWRSAMDNLQAKLRLVELLPASLAAPVEAWLALAAKRCNRLDWSAYLKQRAELLVEPAQLRAEEPAFAELWAASEDQ